MLDTWQEIVAASGGALAIVGLIGVIIIGVIRRGGVVEGGKDGFRLGGKIEKKKPPHFYCPHASDILSVVARTTELAEERARLQNETVSSQMKFFEEVERELRGNLQRVFLSALSNLSPPDSEVVESGEYSAYVATLSMMGRELRDWYRVIMRQNHLSQYEGDEWTKYKDRKKAFAIQFGTDLLNQYWRGKIVTRSILYKVNTNEGINKLVEDALDTILEQARQEAKNAEKSIAEARSNYERWLRDKITG